MNTSYLHYLRSHQWQKLRQIVMERDSYRCQVWLDHPGEEVHHRTYARFGHEDLDDLITLCRECHDAITTIVRRQRHQRRKLSTTDHQRISTIVEIERQQMQITFTDVLRRIPLIMERTMHGVSIPEIPTYRRRTHDYAQWANERPTQPVFESLEKNLGQTEQDRRRLRRDGED